MYGFDGSWFVVLGDLINRNQLIEIHFYTLFILLIC